MSDSGSESYWGSQRALALEAVIVLGLIYWLGGFEAAVLAGLTPGLTVYLETPKQGF